MKGEQLSAKRRRKLTGAVLLLIGGLIAAASTIQLLDYPDRATYIDPTLQRIDAEAFSIQNSIMVVLGYVIGLAGLGLMLYRPGKSSGHGHRPPKSLTQPSDQPDPSSPAEKLRQELEAELGPDEGFYAHLPELVQQHRQRGA